MLLCCLFLFSGSLTVFAEDETVLDGYHVDDVPYNTNFDAVLVASDNGSQLYSSSENKTYKTSSVLSAPATTVQPLYTAKSITNMCPNNIWRGSNSPTITFPVLDGYTGVKYVWASASESSSNSYWHLNEARIFTFFKSERKYRVSFQLIIKSKVKGTFDFYLASKSDTSNPVIPLCSYSAKIGSGDYLTSASRFYSLEFTTPNGIDELTSVVKGGVYGTEFLFYINDFTVTDITSEDLDNSLGKLGDRIKGFFDNLVESIKGFFVPDEGFFETTKEKFDVLLSDHLGFLYQAPAMVGDIFQVVSDWNPPDQPSITLPAFNFTIAGHAVHLWDEQVYTFDFLSSQPWSTLYAIYKTFVFVLLSVAMINLAIKKYHDIVGGGSSDDN